MTWTRALGYVMVWLALSAYYLATHRPFASSVDAPPAAATPAVAFLRMRAEDIVSLDLEVGGREIRANRRGGRWFLVEPPGRAASSDLFSAFVSSLVDVADVEIVSRDEERDAEFGFDRPATRLRLRDRGGTTVTLTIGAKNPAQTAVYARSEGSPEVLLLGLNTEYYMGLILQAAGASR
jgi:hypothetical protein